MFNDHSSLFASPTLVILLFAKNLEEALPTYYNKIFPWIIRKNGQNSSTKETKPHHLLKR
jgi:hypothetical protein